MIATLLVDLLVAAARVLSTNAIGEFGKGTGKAIYEALKNRLAKEDGVKSIDLLERATEVRELRDLIRSEIEASKALNDPETLQLMEELRRELCALPPEEAAYAVEGGDFKAGEDIIARHVEGLRNVSMEAKGSIDISGARSPGKR